jgi:hypothetical protein
MKEGLIVQPLIPGGYILLSRKILNNEIMKKPPLYFKIWAWILLNAQHKDYGNLKRGQLFTSIPEMQEAMSYKVGYRIEKPTKKQIWGVLEWLRNSYEGNTKVTTNVPMIETTKVTHGIIITVVNYDLYQTPSNYESNNEGNDERMTKGQRKKRQGNNINKNDKNVKNDKNEKEYNKKLVDDSTESPIADEKPRYDVDSVYYQAALYLKNKILSFNPQCKVPKDNPKSMDKWANDIRLILERDKRSKKELATIIDYVFDYDDFWKAQIQSPSGLRKHWDKIQGKMLSKQNNSNGVNKVINFQEQIDRMADW